MASKKFELETFVKLFLTGTLVLAIAGFVPDRQAAAQDSAAQDSAAQKENAISFDLSNDLPTDAPAPQTESQLFTYEPLLLADPTERLTPGAAVRLFNPNPAFDSVPLPSIDIRAKKDAAVGSVERTPNVTTANVATTPSMVQQASYNESKSYDAADGTAIDTVDDPSERHPDANVKPVEKLQYAGQLGQLYQSHFADTVPAELIESLAGLIAEQKSAMQKSQAEGEAGDEQQKLAELKNAELRLAKALVNKTRVEKLEFETRAAPEQIRNFEKSLELPLDPLPQPTEVAAIEEIERQIERLQSRFATGKLQPQKTAPAVGEGRSRLVEFAELKQHLQTQLDGAVTEIELQKEQIQSQFATEKLQLQKIETAVEERRNRLAAVAELKQRIQTQLDEAVEHLAAISFDANEAINVDALNHLAVAIASAVEMKMLQAETDRDTAVSRLDPLRIENEKRVLQRTEDHIALLTKTHASLIQKQKQQIAEKARFEAARAHPLIRELAEENTQKADSSAKMTRQLQQNQQELDAIQQRREEQSLSFTNLKRKVDAAGTTQTVGMLLRNHRRHLPSIAKSYERVQKIESELPGLNLYLIEYEEEEKLLTRQLNELRSSNPRTQVSDLLIAEGDTERSLHLPEITPELRQKTLDSANTKQLLLRQLIKDYTAEIKVLSDLESEHRALIEQTNECRFFVDKHVLWIRSGEPVAFNDLQQSVVGMRSVMNVNNWSELVSKVREGLRDNPIQAAVGLIVFIALITFRGRLTLRLKRIDSELNPGRITPLVRSLLLSLLLAAVFPAVMLIAGFLLKSPYDTGSLKAAASHALLTIGPIVLVASFLYRVCMPGGLAEKRLDWQPQVTRTLRKLIMMLNFFCFPMIFVYELMATYSDGAFAESLGRLALIGSMIVFGVANMRAFRATIKYLREVQTSKLSKILLQWRWIWLALFVGAPISLAAFAAMGYSYSTVQLGGRMMMTFWLVLLIAFVYSLVARIAMMAEQTIAAGIRRRRFFERKSNDPAVKSEEEKSEEDLKHVNVQVQRLLRFSSVVFALVIGWQLWSEVLPAVQILETIEIGETTTSVAVSSRNEAGESIETLEDRVVPVTLNHLLACCGILALTFVLSRNLPGLLQVTFLNRLPIDRGGKYAISIVLRYLVAIAGTVLGFRMIGFTWDSLQWLVAAMSVGLGFGLQEIFGNFVSGLIILFERPVRVGDMVTVNDTTGWVTRIQLRATTITDLDRRELVVPNKKFITDDVINWTLTDPITRMTIPVGVAYGSDTRLAEQALLQVAADHRLVLKDPAPVAHFACFGASSLDFELRIFIAGREMYHQVQHEVHMAIDKAFRDLQIEIAFPQQDLHIRSVDANAMFRTGEGAAANVELRREAA